MVLADDEEPDWESAFVCIDEAQVAGLAGYFKPASGCYRFDGLKQGVERNGHGVRSGIVAALVQVD